MSILNLVTRRALGAVHAAVAVAIPLRDRLRQQRPLPCPSRSRHPSDARSCDLNPSPPASPSASQVRDTTLSRLRSRVQTFRHLRQLLDHLVDDPHFQPFRRQLEQMCVECDRAIESAEYLLASWESSSSQPSVSPAPRP